jgi:hypothetical protein
MNWSPRMELLRVGTTRAPMVVQIQCCFAPPPGRVRAIDRVRASGCENAAALQPAIQQTAGPRYDYSANCQSAVSRAGSPLDRDLVTGSATGYKKRAGGKTLRHLFKLVLSCCQLSATAESHQGQPTEAQQRDCGRFRHL